VVVLGGDDEEGVGDNQTWREMGHRFGQRRTEVPEVLGQVPWARSIGSMVNPSCAMACLMYQLATVEPT
jgi:hypothetical protein